MSTKPEAMTRQQLAMGRKPGRAMVRTRGSGAGARGLAREEGGERSLLDAGGMREGTGDDAGAKASAAGVSLHATILSELEELGPMGRADAGGDGARGKDAGDDDVTSAGGPHHLYYDRAKGWMLRVTVDIGKSVVGKRLKFRLRTRDAAEAEKARDLVLATLKRLGLTVRLRMQVGQAGSK